MFADLYSVLSLVSGVSVVAATTAIFGLALLSFDWLRHRPK